MGITKSKEDSSPGTGKIDLGVFPVRVDTVSIEGLERTYDDYVERTAKKMFVAQNMAELLDAARDTHAELMELGIFKHLTVNIDTSKGEGATTHGYGVTFKGVELLRYKGHIGTEIGPEEGSFVTELASPNLFGRGERVSISGSYSNQKNSDMTLRYLKPFYHTRLGDLKPEFSVALLRQSTLFDWSKFQTKHTGISVEGSLYFPQSVAHSLRYDVHLRDTMPYTKDAPLFVREHFGPRLTNILGYMAVFDTRDSTVFPRDGVRVKSSHELINASFKHLGYMRNEVHAEVNCPLFAGLSLQFSGRIGNIIDLGNHERVTISDQFFLGGAQSLRGFVPGGASEQKQGAAVGSNVYWIGSAHLWSPLPFTRIHSGSFASLFRTHIFANFGQTREFTAEKLRCAAGIGLALRIGDRARIEFNYCYPIRHETGDIRKNFQFGIGYEFT